MPRNPGYTAYSPTLDGSEMTRDEWEFLLAIAGFKDRSRYLTARCCTSHDASAIARSRPVAICEPLAGKHEI